MNITLTIIVCFICLFLGWAVGTINTNKRLDALDSAIDLIDESSETINVNNMLLMKAAEEILYLQQVESQEYGKIEQQLIDNLRNIYRGIKETVDDGMANDNEIAFANQLEALAKTNETFQKIVAEEKNR